MKDALRVQEASGMAYGTFNVEKGGREVIK